VLHLAQTDEMALASVQGRFLEGLGELTAGLAPSADVDEGAALMVERDRSLGVDATYERWRTGSARLREAFASVDPSRRVTWVAGELSARTLTTTRLAESWIHTGDVAVALGVRRDVPDRIRHIARLAWRTIPYAFTRAGHQLSGPVAFHLTGPRGEAWDFDPDGAATTVVIGPAIDLCLVAGRRLPWRESALSGEGADVHAVLDLVRTYA
jgi:uncharacterized protein (TIGR03084 family)